MTRIVSSKASVLMALVLFCGLMSCELGPPDSAEPAYAPVLEKEIVPADLCELSAKPQCMDGCGTGIDAGEPICNAGQWACKTGIESTYCPEYLGSCSPTQPCGPGYSCVKTLFHPVPSETGMCRKGEVPRNAMLESCSDTGTIAPADFVRDRDLLTGNVVKFAGRIGVTLTCGADTCTEADPCCNNCVANYMVEITDPLDPGVSINVLVRTESLPCAGTNCGMTCSPLMVGDTYRLWGLLDGCKGQSQCTVLYMGACPL